MLDTTPDVSATEQPLLFCNALSKLEDFANGWGDNSCDRVQLGTDAWRFDCLPDESASPKLMFVARVTRKFYSVPTMLSFEEYRSKHLRPREPVYDFAYGDCDCGRQPTAPGVDYCMFIANR